MKWAEQQSPPHCPRRNKSYATDARPPVCLNGMLDVVLKTLLPSPKVKQRGRGRGDSDCQVTKILHTWEIHLRFIISNHVLFQYAPILTEMATIEKNIPPLAIQLIQHYVHSDIVVPMSETILEASQHLCSAAISSAEKRNVITSFLIHVKRGMAEEIDINQIKGKWWRWQCGYDIDSSQRPTHFNKDELKQLRICDHSAPARIYSHIVTTKNLNKKV